jgi:hypothetical protein
MLQVGESVDPEDVEDVDSLMHIHRRLDDDDVPELLDLEQVHYMIWRSGRMRLRSRRDCL